MAADFISDDQVLATLRSTFGFTSFRPLQGDVVRSILGRRDVFVLMPTGGGKSLCYQLPALLLEGLTVVVSPLIALMKDQVDGLQALGVAASFINSSLDSSEVGRRQAAVARGEVKLLYVAPERLMMPGFLHLLAAVRPACFAIDEAHCISEWGHDFRPEYRQLNRLRELFPSTVLGAFTATATRRVQADIKSQLGLHRAASFQGSYNRFNLFYEVWPKENAYEQLVSYLRRRRSASGIIYCLTRAGTESLATSLKGDGFDAVAYHAGLESEERRQRQEAFIRDNVQIVVATIAFGMGIDKPDVRFVIHYDIPRSLEGYYQESGRAGRDGEPSDCILIFSYGDVARHRYFIKEKPSAEERQIALHQLRQMANWAASSVCRRRVLLAYFDEALQDQPDPCCDVCRMPVEEVDYTIPAQKFLSCIKRTGERFGTAHVIHVLRGSRGERILRLGHDKLSTYGIGKDISEEEWRYLAGELLRRDYIVQAQEEYNAVKVTESGRAVLFKGEKVLLARPRAPWSAAAAESSDLDFQHLELFHELRGLRKRLADERGVPPYVIFHDATLRQMAAEIPRSREHLLRLQGVGLRKAEDYGEAFLKLIAEYVALTGIGPVPASGPQSSSGQAKSASPTVRATLNLFNKGLSVAEIASARDLAVSTVEGHLADAMEAGEQVDLGRLVGDEKRRAIEAAMAQVGTNLLRPVMDALGDGYTFAELRYVRAALEQRGRP